MFKILEEIALAIFTFTIVYYLIETNNAKAEVNPYTYIPAKAYKLMPIVNDEQKKFFPSIPIPYYFGGLIEQESCVTLTSNKCEDPTAELRTSRELGQGIGQLTKAYTKDGKIRFDSLSDMVRLHNTELKELSWNNITKRPDLQARTIILMTKDNDRILYSIKDDKERINFDDAAYNGGVRDVLRARTVCGLKKDCDPNKWFSNVGDVCVKSPKIIYGQTACSINTKHVSNVIKIRMNKYKQFFN